MWKFAPLAFKNCLRNKRRTLLTIASIAVSLLLLSVLVAVYHAFYYREGPPQEALRLITRSRVSLAIPLPSYYESRIRQVRGIREVCSWSWFGGIYMDNRPEHFFPQIAVEPDKIFKVYPEFKVAPEELKAFQAERTAAAIGKSLAEKQNFKLGQKITLRGNIYPMDLELTIRAIFEGNQRGSEGVLYFHRLYLDEGLPSTRKAAVQFFIILADSPDAVPRVAGAVDDMFRNADRQTKTESERAFQLSFIAMLGNVKLFLLSICAAVVFTLLLVSANTMAMSVRERIKEIGVLKTLGFTTGQVLVIIMAESVIVALIGGLLGCALAYGGCWVVAQSPVMANGLPLPPIVVVISLCVAFVIGIVSSVIPAVNASRVPITEALRHVG